MRNGTGAMNRRDFIKTGLVAAAVLPIADAVLRPLPARADDTKLITELPDQAAMVTALQYVNESAKADQDCANCQFFTPAADGARGKCQLFPTGMVTAKGWCASYVKKVT
jgi:hypothetical protein